MLPARITLLVGVPVDEEQFLCRVRESDWLRRYTPPRSVDPLVFYGKCWRSEYSPIVATPLVELMQRAGEMGATVKTRATLADLRDATDRADIVVLLSHWKGPEFSNDDFVQPVMDGPFVERATNDASPLGRWLARQFASNRIGAAAPVAREGFLVRAWAAVAGPPKAKTLRTVLRDSLHAEIDDIATLGADRVIEAEITRATRRREYLNGLFGGLIREGNRLELFDGLHAKESVEQMVAPGFEGVLDLTTCTSMNLADYISAKRQYRLRTVQFDTTQDVGWAARCLGFAFALMAEGQPYQEARQLACETMADLVRSAARERELH